MIFRDDFRKATMTVTQDSEDSYVKVVVTRELEDDDLSTIRIGLELDAEALIPLTQMGSTALSSEIRQFLATADENLSSASPCPTCGVIEGACENPRSGERVQQPHRNRADKRISALVSQRSRAMELLRQVVE